MPFLSVPAKSLRRSCGCSCFPGRFKIISYFTPPCNIDKPPKIRYSIQSPKRPQSLRPNALPPPRISSAAFIGCRDRLADYAGSPLTWTGKPCCTRASGVITSKAPVKRQPSRSRFLPWHVHNLIWSGIEVVITGLTRNQLTGNRPWVRIPPAPPQAPESTTFSGAFSILTRRPALGRRAFSFRKAVIRYM